MCKKWPFPVVIAISKRKLKIKCEHFRFECSDNLLGLSLFQSATRLQIVSNELELDKWKIYIFVSTALFIHSFSVWNCAERTRFPHLFPNFFLCLFCSAQQNRCEIIIIYLWLRALPSHAVCAHATCTIVSALNKFDRAIDWSSSCEWQLEIYQLLFRSLPQFALRGFLSAHMPRTQHTVKRANGSRPFLVPNSHTQTHTHVLANNHRMMHSTTKNTILNHQQLISITITFNETRKKRGEKNRSFGENKKAHYFIKTNYA